MMHVLSMVCKGTKRLTGDSKTTSKRMNDRYLVKSNTQNAVKASNQRNGDALDSHVGPLGKNFPNIRMHHMGAHNQTLCFSSSEQYNSFETSIGMDYLLPLKKDTECVLPRWRSVE